MMIGMRGMAQEGLLGGKKFYDGDKIKCLHHKRSKQEIDHR
jgi:hypothetical protein